MVWTRDVNTTFFASSVPCVDPTPPPSTCDQHSSHSLFHSGLFKTCPSPRLEDCLIHLSVSGHRVDSLCRLGWKYTQDEALLLLQWLWFGGEDHSQTNLPMFFVFCFALFFWLDHPRFQVLSPHTSEINVDHLKPMPAESCDLKIWMLNCIEDLLGIKHRAKYFNAASVTLPTTSQSVVAHSIRKRTWIWMH